jgi:predicted XRE-type DNA-binding protein
MITLILSGQLDVKNILGQKLSGRGTQMAQNLFALFTDDPVEYNLKHFKTQLLMVLITLIRNNGWTHAKAAEELKVSRPRISNLYNGHMDKFSIDMLIELLVRSDSQPDAYFNPANSEEPQTIRIKDFKARVYMVLIQLIRDNDWTQAKAADVFKVSTPRISNLCNGQLEKFSTDTLLEMLVRGGFKLDADFNPSSDGITLTINLKKALI